MAGITSKAYKIAFNLDAKMEKGFGKTFDEAESRFTSIGNKLNSLGKGLTLGVTVPLLGIGVAALAVGADYDNSLSKIQARTNMTAEEVDKLSASIREMALSGEYGIFSARKIADAYGSVAVAGQDAAYGTAIMRSSMVMATATGNDLSQTAYFLGNYLLKIGADASESEKYINLFTQGILNTGMGLSDMQNYMFRMTPAFEQMGSSAETNVGIMTRLYQVGVRGAALYSGMGTIISDFALGGNIAAAATERFGVATHYANGMARAIEDILFDTAIAMRDYGDQAEVGRFKLDNLNQSQQAAWFEFMRNAELIQNEVIPGFYEATSAIEGTGVAFDKAALQQEGMNGSVQQLRNSLEEIMLQISEHLLPHAIRFVDFIGVWINRFASLDDGTQRIILRLALVAAAAGPVLMVMGKIVKFVGKAHAAYKTFTGTLKAVKTATELVSAAQAANTTATKVNTAVAETAKKATAARKAATVAETKALKLASQAEIVRAQAGAGSAKAIAAATKVEQARTVATQAAKIATKKQIALDKIQANATKVNTAELNANTASQKANALAASKLGKAYALALKAKTASIAGLQAKSAALAAVTVKSKILAGGLKGLSVAFKVMSLAIKAIPIFGWIIAGVTGAILIVTRLVRWLNRVGEEYQTVGEEAERLADRQESLAQSSTEAVESFNHEVRVLEARAEQYEELASCIDHATSMYNLHRNEINRVSMEYTELGLGLEDTRSQISTIEAKLADGSNRRRRDTRALEDALDSLRVTENAYVEAMEANRRIQADFASGIEVHADVLADLERQQQEAAAAMAVATAEMEEQMRKVEEWEKAQTQALDRMNASFENYKRLTTNAFRTVTENAAVSVADLTNNLISNAASIEEWSKNIATLTERGLDEGLIEQLRQAGPEAAATVRGLVDASYEELDALNEAFSESTRVAVESMQRELDPMGVANSAEELIDHVAVAILENQAMENALIDKVNSGFAVFSNSIDNAGFDDAGYNMTLGVAQGIDNGVINIERALVNAGNRGVAAFERSMGINSPAKRMTPYGGYTVDGYTGGIYKKAGDVEKAFEWIGNYGISKMPNITPNIKLPKSLGRKSNVTPFPSKSNAFTAQTCFSRYNHLNDDSSGGYNTPIPADTIKRIEDANYHQGGDVSVNYNPVYNIQGGGHSIEELKTMFDQLNSEGESRFKQLILQVMCDEEYRKERLSNA